MIFVTVGSQMPFDRLIRAVDKWAESSARTDVVAQIGDTDLQPRSLDWSSRVSATEFEDRCRDATAIVAHAGMGSILTALQYGTPILVMPRRADLRETRNDHQVATAARLSERGLVHVAMDDDELPGCLDRLGELTASERISPYASAELLDAVRGSIRAADPG
jgi:UDP-N-acetylglucosamine transferase subunit ALG13